MEELKITRERAIKRMEWILKHEIYCSDKLSHAAINMAITALRSTEPENKVLTAEQLKCMNHKPVWATGKRSLGTEVNGWMLVNATSSRPAALDFAGACNFDSYGKTWIAYARKPEGRKK
jgi:hypothetical protein